MDPQRRVIENGAVVITADRIAEVGLAQAALDTPFPAAVGRDPKHAVEELQLGQPFFLGRGEQLIEFVFGS